MNSIGTYINACPTWFLAPKFKPTYSKGISLVEILIALSILAILATFALPSFKATIERYRVRAAVEAMRSSFYLARTEAMRRGGHIVIRKNDACATWQCGWTIFMDENGNNQQDSNEPSLQEIAEFSHITVRNNARRSHIRFNRWGYADGLGALGFGFFPVNEERSAAAMALCVSSGGRLRIVHQRANCGR